MKKVWMFTPEKPKKAKPTEQEKREISEKCQNLVEEFKKKCINPNNSDNYLIDIYTKWYQNYFYFCEKFKSESPNRLKDEFEIKFVRLTFKGADCFDFSYLRHTEQWWLVSENLALEDCLKAIRENPNFQPLG